MSTYIGAFHTYGLLLTEKLTATLLENAKKNWKFTKPDSYEEIKDYEEPLEFIEYLENDNVATRFINIECYEITRLYDNESSSLDNVVEEQLSLIELNHFPSLFSKPYNSFENIIDEVRDQLYNLLPKDFSFNEYLVEIQGVIIG
ncbi:hypothetical protein [Dorea longicatena]|uniref:hypothetical protein n=1 Tax=Dorea longicatena TaxID=88431 RepID=UPI0032C0881A